MTTNTPTSEATPGMAPATDGAAVNEESLDSWDDAPNPVDPVRADGVAETADDGAAATGEEGDGNGDGDGEAVDPYAEAPEFWSAERKAQWAKITDPELRQAIHEQEKERTTAVNKKIEDAALGRRDLETKVQQFGKERDELVAWWTDLAPKLGTAFQSKWAKINWQELASTNPAEFVKLTAERDAEFGLLKQTFDRNQAEVTAAQGRAATALADSKKVEHGKLAEKFPQHFSGEKAQETYDALRDYLLEQGVPAKTIPNIYEAHVVGVALKAMLYDRAKALAAKPKPKTDTATQTPARVVPGPARTGNQRGDADRQAEKRLRDGEQLSEKDVERLFG